MSARFYVGQRVRVVRAENNPGVNGTETHIIALGLKAGEEVFGGRNECDADCMLALKTRWGTHYLADFEQIEPLTDPGRQVVSWEGSIWMPEHLREKAPESEGVKV